MNFELEDDDIEKFLDKICEEDWYFTRCYAYDYKTKASCLYGKVTSEVQESFTDKKGKIRHRIKKITEICGNCKGTGKVENYSRIQSLKKLKKLLSMLPDEPL